METKNAIIRPYPIVFDDYTDENFKQPSQISQEHVSQSVKIMIASQGVRVYITEQAIYPDKGGILIKYKGVPYLRQGFVFPEAMDNANNLKKVTVLFLAVLQGKGIKGRIGTFLAHYCHIANWMFQWYDPNSQKVRKIYLKENRYRQSVQELIKLINNFLDNLGIKVQGHGVANGNFGRVIGTLFEYDNAYHWRMEDIFSETTKDQLIKNPKKELKRLLEIYKSREKQGIEFKAEAIVKLLNFVFWIPGVKKAFIKAVESVDISKMGITHAPANSQEPCDYYFIMNYEGYDFEGKTIEERQKIWLSMTNGVPPPRVFIPAQN